MGCLLIVYWNYGGFQSIPIGCFPVVGIPPGPVSDLTSPSHPSPSSPRSLGLPAPCTPGAAPRPEPHGESCLGRS